MKDKTKLQELREWMEYVKKHILSDETLSRKQRDERMKDFFATINYINSAFAEGLSDGEIEKAQNQIAKECEQYCGSLLEAGGDKQLILDVLKDGVREGIKYVNELKNKQI